MSDSSVCPVCGGEGPNAHEAKLAHLAKGEEVVSNLSGQADWARPLLQAINRARPRSLHEALGSDDASIKRWADRINGRQQDEGDES